tara:strand:+ start:165 stop:545 length:381 start_codon:yes stop_codon:yes gene_type:complete
MDDLLKQTKLLDWKRIATFDIKEGMHLKCTSNKYKEAGRKCQHVVVQKILEGDIHVNSYGEKKYNDWLLKPTCPYKQQRYYERIRPITDHTGICLKCKEAKVNPPYFICIFCKYNKTDKPKTDKSN